MSKMTQRDAFFQSLYKMAREDKNVVVVSADMSAPALDKFREDFPTQFVNVGIAEQNAIQIASGLAMTGKKVFAYAISPFITLRCLEQIRVSNAIMGIPIVIVGMGTGFSYCNDGPTHHLIEDIAVMRAFPKIKIVNLTDNVMAAAFAAISHKSGLTTYLRVDKDIYPDIYHIDYDFSLGIGKLCEGKNLVITSGPMTHVVREIIQARRFKNVGHIDLFEIPINEAPFIGAIKGAKKIVTIEEHFLAGGMGSAVLEIMNDNGINIPVKRIGINLRDGYKNCYMYGGRNIIRSCYGIDSKSLTKKIQSYFEK